MKKLTSSGSGLFLLELMISIVFFAIAAAGCVQIFAKAHLLSTQAEELDQAVSIAQSLVETSSGQVAESKTWYFDSLGGECERADASYQAEVTIQEEGTLRQIQVSVSDAQADAENSVQEPIYQLETKVFCQKEPDTQKGQVNGDE